MTSVLLDLDGTCYSFVRAMNTYCLSKYSHLSDSIIDVDDHSTWNWYSSWNWTNEKFTTEMQEAVLSRELWWSGCAYEKDLWNTIQGLRANGHTIHVVTHRGAFLQALEATTHWVSEELGDVDSLTLEEDKCKVFYDYAIEDSLQQYDNLVRNGTRALLINRGYNHRDDNRYRFATVREAAEYILWKENGD